MSISIFDVAGPVMIGPSSSHTAGAARLGRMAALLAGGEFSRVEFGLYGRTSVCLRLLRLQSGRI